MCSKVGVAGEAAVISKVATPSYPHFYQAKKKINQYILLPFTSFYSFIWSGSSSENVIFQHYQCPHRFRAYVKNIFKGKTQKPYRNLLIVHTYWTLLCLQTDLEHLSHKRELLSMYKINFELVYLPKPFEAWAYKFVIKPGHIDQSFIVTKWNFHFGIDKFLKIMVFLN